MLAACFRGNWGRACGLHHSIHVAVGAYQRRGRAVAHAAAGGHGVPGPSPQRTQRCIALRQEAVALEKRLFAVKSRCARLISVVTQGGKQRAGQDDACVSRACHVTSSSTAGCLADGCGATRSQSQPPAPAASRRRSTHCMSASPLATSTRSGASAAAAASDASTSSPCVPSGATQEGMPRAASAATSARGSPRRFSGASDAARVARRASTLPGGAALRKPLSKAATVSRGCTCAQQQ